MPVAVPGVAGFSRVAPFQRAERGSPRGSPCGTCFLGSSGLPVAAVRERPVRERPVRERPVRVRAARAAPVPGTIRRPSPKNGGSGSSTNGTN